MTGTRNGDDDKMTATNKAASKPKSRARSGTKKAATKKTGTKRTSAKKASSSKATAKKTTKKTAKKSTKKATTKAAGSSKRSSRKAKPDTGVASTASTNLVSPPPVLIAADLIDGVAGMQDDLFTSNDVQTSEELGFAATSEAAASPATAEAFDFSDSCATAVASEDEAGADFPSDDLEAAELVGLAAETEALMSSLLDDVTDAAELQRPNVEPTANTPVADAAQTYDHELESMDDVVTDEDPIGDREPESAVETPTAASAAKASPADESPTAEQAGFAVSHAHESQLTFGLLVCPFLVGLGLGMLIGLVF